MAAWNRRRFCASGAVGLGAVGLGSSRFPASGRAGSGPDTEVAGVRRKADLPTPALLVDLDRLQANIEKMAEHCRGTGCALRPHAKTHKCPEVARATVGRGGTGYLGGDRPGGRGDGRRRHHRGAPDLADRRAGEDRPDGRAGPQGSLGHAGRGPPARGRPPGGGRHGPGGSTEHPGGSRCRRPSDRHRARPGRRGAGPADRPLQVAANPGPPGVFRPLVPRHRVRRSGRRRRERR